MNEVKNFVGVLKEKKTIQRRSKKNEKKSHPNIIHGRTNYKLYTVVFGEETMG